MGSPPDQNWDGAPSRGCYGDHWIRRCWRERCALRAVGATEPSTEPTRSESRRARRRYATRRSRIEAVGATEPNGQEFTYGAMETALLRADGAWEPTQRKSLLARMSWLGAMLLVSAMEIHSMPCLESMSAMDIHWNRMEIHLLLGDSLTAVGTLPHFAIGAACYGVHGGTRIGLDRTRRRSYT